MRRCSTCRASWLRLKPFSRPAIDEDCKLIRFASRRNAGKSLECGAFEAAGIGITIADLPTLRSKKAAAWIGPTITTKVPGGDDGAFHPTAGGLIAAASGSYVVKAQMPESDGERCYPIKHPTEPHERIATQSELRFCC